MCSEFLKLQLSAENCMEMAKFANDIGMWDLKAAAELFLLENVGQIAQVQQDFFKMHYSLFIQILQDSKLLIPKEETVSLQSINR